MKLIAAYAALININNIKVSKMSRRTRTPKINQQSRTKKRSNRKSAARRTESYDPLQNILQIQRGGNRF